MTSTSKATYSRQEAANYLGVGLNTLDSLINRHFYPLPHFNVGRRVLIPKESLEEWLKAETERRISAD